MLEIKDWKNVFYLAEAWKHAEVWWTKFPVARASVSYRRLMATRDGHTAFCVFIGLLRMVQRGKTQGVLVVKGKAITAIDVAAETGISVKWCQAGMKMLESEEIGWLVPHVAGRVQADGERTADERRDDGGEPADGRRMDGVTPSKRREEKRREENNSSSSKTPVAVRGPVRHQPLVAAAAGLRQGERPEDGPPEKTAEKPSEKPAEPIRDALVECGIAEPTLSRLADGLARAGITEAGVRAAWAVEKGRGKGVGALIRSLERDCEQAAATARKAERFAGVWAWWKALDQLEQRDIATVYLREKHRGVAPKAWIQSDAWWEWALAWMGAEAPRGPAKPGPCGGTQASLSRAAEVMP